MTDKQTNECRPALTHAKHSTRHIETTTICQSFIIILLSPIVVNLVDDEPLKDINEGYQ